MLAVTSSRRNRAHTAAPINSPMSTPRTIAILNHRRSGWSGTTTASVHLATGLAQDSKMTYSRSILPDRRIAVTWYHFGERA
jgi:hypothetical protein